jgi:hypothetical protein
MGNGALSEVVKPELSVLNFAYSDLHLTVVNFLEEAFGCDLQFCWRSVLGTAGPNGSRVLLGS